MNDNNLNNTNTNPAPVANTDVNTSSVNNAPPVIDNGVNVINPESIVGEIPTATSNVVPREEIANINVSANQSSVNVNIESKPTEEPKSNAVNDKLKNAEINYKPPSKTKVILLIIFFVVLISFVLFLPQINEMIVKYKSGHYDEDVVEITTGKLTCTLADSDTNLNFDYTNVFSFEDNKLKKMQLTSVIRGDITLDEETLDALAEKCNLIDTNSKEIDGATIKCEYVEGKLTQRQTLDLSVIDVEKITSAFTEAGGQYPKYKYNQDISEIEKEMNASGYSCKKEAN